MRLSKLNERHCSRQRASVLAQDSGDRLPESFGLDVPDPVVSYHPFSINQEKGRENRDAAISLIAFLVQFTMG